MRKKSPHPEPKIAPSAPAKDRGPLWYAGASIALLLPCFWQSRVQAGDLSSHIYNAWLAQLIGRGQAPGLRLAPQTTNILFDWILSALFAAFGVGLAERLAAALAVLVFAWGSFAFISKVSERRAWHMLPWIGMLAYGWVFHMGFFGFYLSLGLCFWAMSFAWDLDRRGLAIAAPLFAVAYVSHALPVGWSAGVLAYLWTARRVGEEASRRLLLAALATVAILRFAVSAALHTRWFPSQLSLITGADQLHLFDGKYIVVAAIAAVLCGLRLRRLGKAAQGPLLQICFLTSVGIALLPTGVLIPGYNSLLTYIAERMSLPLAILLCGVLAPAPGRSFERYLTAAAALLFAGMLFRDELRLNRFEDQIEAAVSQLPPMQRVISGIDQPSLRANPISHLVDRACIGRCYSYANYEPSTAQFRVRADRPNPIVAWRYIDVAKVQSGEYEVKESDLPLYQLLVDDRGQVQMRIPPAGQPCGTSSYDVL